MSNSGGQFPPHGGDADPCSSEKNTSRPRVLLADDHVLILEGFRVVLGQRCELLGALQDGKALVEAALRTQPDIVILDISLPTLNGIDAARQIKKALPKTIVIFLTMHANPSYLRTALSIGAAGYVLKTSAREELLVAVDRALKGEVYVSKGFGETIVDHFRAARGRISPPPSLLTPRQREILQLIAEGRTTKEMAAILNISVQAIAFHKYQIMNKLGIRTTAELTRYAIMEGLIPL